MRSMKVLLVEDDLEIADMLDFNLQNHGYEVTKAHTGLAACQQIGADRPDLILLDLMLPDFDGREICKMIRGHSDDKISEIPIVMLTAVAGTEDRVFGLELGADDYITKPFSVEELLARLKKLTNPRRWREGEALASGIAREEERKFLEFQDMVFHELTNQLMVVRGFSDRLHKHGDILPQNKVRSYAEAIYRSSEHLGSLAEEMLLLRRLRENGKEVIKHDIDLKVLAKEISDVVGYSAEAKGISLMVDVAGGFPLLKLNQPSLKIILSCLLDNAVKYGRRGGKALLTASLTPDGSAVIQVEDDGCGIPEGEESLIFEKFHRGSNVAANTKGTGLGLYFARTLAEALGGSLTLDSEPGTGTRFRLRFPPAETSQPA